MNTEYFWLAETESPPAMYAAESAFPRLELTPDAVLAHRFDSEAECQTWCAGKSPPLVARLHGFG